MQTNNIAPGFYIDFEFTSKGGPPISLGIVHEDSDTGRYFIFNDVAEKMIEKKVSIDQWALDNVYDVLWKVPYLQNPQCRAIKGNTSQITQALMDYINEIGGDGCCPHFMADWPIHFAYLSELLITGSGLMVDLSSYTTTLYRVDSYPNDFVGLFQHNALCDATALKLKMRQLKQEPEVKMKQSTEAVQNTPENTRW